MKFYEFVHNRFQENMRTVEKKGFSWLADGESEAIMFWFKGVRLFWKTIFIVRTPFHFAAVLLHIVAAPRPAMDIALAEKNAAEKVGKETASKLMVLAYPESKVPSEQT